MKITLGISTILIFLVGSVAVGQYESQIMGQVQYSSSDMLTTQMPTGTTTAGYEVGQYNTSQYGTTQTAPAGMQMVPVTTMQMVPVTTMQAVPIQRLLLFNRQLLLFSRNQLCNNLLFNQYLLLLSNRSSLLFRLRRLLSQCLKCCLPNQFSNSCPRSRF